MLKNTYPFKGTDKDFPRRKRKLEESIRVIEALKEKTPNDDFLRVGKMVLVKDLHGIWRVGVIDTISGHMTGKHKTYKIKFCDPDAGFSHNNNSVDQFIPHGSPIEKILEHIIPYTPKAVNL